MAAQVGCPSVPVAGQICDAVVGGAKDVVSAPFQFAGDQLAKWLVGGVSDAGTAVVQGLGHVLDSSTTPNLGASWFLGNYNMVLGIASVVVALTFMIQIVSSLIRREPGMIGRAVTGSLIGVVGAFAILAICQAALLGTDELCNGLLSASGTGSMSSSLTKMWGTAVADLGPGAWFLAVFLGVLFIIGAFMLWVAMFLREISIYVLAVFAPIAFAGYGWDRTRTWLRRWGEIVAALIFSKLVIYIVFLLGLSMIGNAGAASGVTGSITQLIGGTCLLLLGALAPWATHRFISFAGNATGDMSEHGSPRGASGAGMMMGVTSAMAVGKTVGGGIVGGPGGAAAGAAGGSQQTAQAAGNAGSPAPGATGGTGGGASTPPGGSGGGASPAPASSGGGGGSAPAPPPAPSSTSSGGGGGNSSPAPSGGGSSGGGGGGGSSAGGAGGGAAAGVGVP